MLKNWWNSREPRERLLMSICALLTVSIGLFQFVFVPSKDFRERELKRFSAQAAINTEVIQTLRLFENSPRQINAVSSGPVQGIVADTSAVFGIVISRIEPTEEGDLTLWIEEIDPRSLYAWILDLESNHGISVNKASIRMNKDVQTVNANVFVSRGS